jgi:hypothetical protein
MRCLQMRRKVSALAWCPITSGARHPGFTGLAGGLCWLIWPLQTYVILAVLMAGALLGDDRRRRSSIVADAVKFSYRRTRIRFRWSKVMQAARLQELRRHPGMADVFVCPRLMHAHWWSHRFTWRRWHTRTRQTPTGITITVDGTNVGIPHSGFEGASATAIQSAFKAHDLFVEKHPKWSHLTQLTLVYLDPFKRVVKLAELTAHQDLGTVNIGKDGNGDQVSMNMLSIQLIVGASRSGKSSVCWTILSGLLLQKLPFRLRVLDPKGGVEFFDLDGIAYCYESDILKCGEFLKTAVLALKTRQAEMKAAEVRKWTPEHADRWPLDVMLIDELLVLVSALKGQKVSILGQKMDATDLLTWYMSQGLASGCMVIGCTQDPKKETVPMRGLFTSSTCLRVESADEVRMAGFNPDTHPAHEIPFGDKHAGRAYARTDIGVKQLRAAYPTDAERAKIAEGVLLQSRIHWAADRQPSNVEFVSTEELVTNGAQK